jgi:hypothetical protein
MFKDQQHNQHEQNQILTPTYSTATEVNRKGIYLVSHSQIDSNMTIIISHIKRVFKLES